MSDCAFVLHVLPAGVGDALIVDYGDGSTSQRILIDGGVPKTSDHLASFLGDHPALELLMVTHIDNDHIAGMLKVLEAKGAQMTIGDVWFNGYRHLPESPLESMGPVEGERLTTLLTNGSQRWNGCFDGGAVKIDDHGVPSVRLLDGGMELTVLSPGHDQLNELRNKWAAVVGEGGLDPYQPVPDNDLKPAGRLERMGGLDIEALAETSTQVDHAQANGSSIAVLCRWGGRSCLFTGDAHADVLLAALDRVVGVGQPLTVDVFQVPHHGSKGNATNALMSRVKAKVYVFSSSGEGRAQHPNDEAVARAIVNSTGDRVLAFNYRNARTEVWDDPALKAKHGYRTMYPNADHGGLTIDLMRC